MDDLLLVYSNTSSLVHGIHFLPYLIPKKSHPHSILTGRASGVSSARFAVRLPLEPPPLGCPLLIIQVEPPASALQQGGGGHRCGQVRQLLHAGLRPLLKALGGPPQVASVQLDSLQVWGECKSPLHYVHARTEDYSWAALGFEVHLGVT